MYKYIISDSECCEFCERQARIAADHFFKGEIGFLTMKNGIGRSR